MNTRIRLPSMPYAAHAPAPAASSSPAPRAAVSAESESFSATYAYPAGEILVYMTTRRWRGIDVFLSTDVDTPAVLTVRVYARVGNTRVLVSTGRFWRGSHALVTQYEVQPPKWVAAARCGASQFDVTVSADFTGTTPDPGHFNVSVFASDQLIEPPYDLGSVSLEAMPVFDSLSSPAGLGYGGPNQDFELIDLWGSATTNNVTGLWFMLFDWPLGGLAPVNGAIPTLVLPLAAQGGVGVPSPIGAGYSYKNLNYRQQQTRLTLRVSSTPILLTIATAATMGIKIR